MPESNKLHRAELSTGATRVGRLVMILMPGTDQGQIRVQFKRGKAQCEQQQVGGYRSNLVTSVGIFNTIKKKDK